MTDIRLSVLILVAVLWAGLPGPPAPAAETPSGSWDESRLGRTRFGEWLGGPTFAKEDLKGNVIVVELWGRHCPRCTVAFPAMVALNARYGSQGVIVIGAHSQDGTKEEVMSAAHAKGATFTIVKGVRIPDDDTRLLPRVYVFDHRGDVAFNGLPDGAMGAAVAAAV